MFPSGVIRNPFEAMTGEPSADTTRHVNRVFWESSLAARSGSSAAVKASIENSGTNEKQMDLGPV